MESGYLVSGELDHHTSEELRTKMEEKILRGTVQNIVLNGEKFKHQEMQGLVQVLFSLISWLSDQDEHYISTPSADKLQIDQIQMQKVLLKQEKPDICLEIMVLASKVIQLTQ